MSEMESQMKEHGSLSVLQWDLDVAWYVFGEQALLTTSCPSLLGQFSPHLCKGSLQKRAAKTKVLFECENTLMVPPFKIQDVKGYISVYLH